MPKDAILHSGQSHFADLIVARINRRGITLLSSEPQPDFMFDDIGAVIPLLAGP